MIAVNVTISDLFAGGYDPASVLAPAIARASGLARIAAASEDVRLRPYVTVRRGPAMAASMDSRGSSDYHASTTWFVAGVNGSSIQLPYRAQIFADALRYGPGIGHIWVRDKAFKAGIPERYETAQRIEKVGGKEIPYCIVCVPWADIVKPFEFRLAAHTVQSVGERRVIYGLKEDK